MAFRPWRPLKVRLLEKRQVRDAGYETKCWEWTGRTFHDGYGVLKYEGKSCRVPRLAYQLFKNKALGKEYVLHRCDNRLCFRPAHLFTGTALDNVQDCIKKGRFREAPTGTLNPAAKVTEADVLAIRALYATFSHTQKDLAEKFNLSQQNVSRIIREVNWAPARKRRMRSKSAGAQNPAAKATMEQVLEIQKLYSTWTYTQKQLAVKFGLSQPSISKIIRGVTWTSPQKGSHGR